MSVWLADRRRWILVTTVLLAAGAAWTVASATPASAVTGGKIPSPREGFLAPDFSVERAEGGRFVLSEARGHPVILNFWASWCPPCRAEMPALARVHADLASEGLEILAVNVTRQDSEAAARGFIADLGLDLPVAFDRDGQVERSYLVRALPTTFFIDAEGVIRTVIIGGPMRESVLRAEAEALLEEPGP
jgi:thiol-disulfide isomerase/thioredoxin